MISPREEQLTVEVTMKFRYSLPRDLAQRKLIYGEVDLRKCVQVDLDTDATILLDGGWDMELVAVAPAPPGEEGPS